MYYLPNSLFYSQNQIKTHILSIVFFPTSAFFSLKGKFWSSKIPATFFIEDFFLLFARFPEKRIFEI